MSRLLTALAQLHGTQGDGSIPSISPTEPPYLSPAKYPRFHMNDWSMLSCCTKHMGRRSARLPKSSYVCVPFLAQVLMAHFIPIMAHTQHSAWVG